VETREGYTCCWCTSKDENIVLQPHSLSPVAVRILRHPRDAEVIGQVVGAQAPASTALRADVRSYARAHDIEIVRELTDFLAIRNLASDGQNIRRNADLLITMMTARGITMRSRPVFFTPPSVMP